MISYRIAETSGLKEVKEPRDIPHGDAFIIQFHETKHIHHEGDERSRQAPGHGYPAYIETLSTVRQFVTQDRQKWRDVLTSIYAVSSAPEGVVAFQAKRPAIRTSIDVEVEE